MSSDGAMHLVDKKGRLWQEKTILVKPNENGYGFSLSGEQPVYLEKLTEGSPAYLAGIRSRDKLIKVNGQSVFDKKHSEVVALLKGATSVELTVISQIDGRSRRPPTAKDTSSPASSTQEFPVPQRIQELTLQALKQMLQRQQRIFEQLTLDYNKAPSSRMEEELKDCEEIIKTLQREVAVKSNTSVEVLTQQTDSSISSLLGSERARQRRGRLARDDTLLGHKILCTVTNEDIDPCPPTPPLEVNQKDTLQMGSPPTSRSPTKFFKSPRLGHRGSLPKALYHSVTASDSMETSGTASPTKLYHQRSLVNDSDTDDDMDYHVSPYGPFSSLQELNNYPAHMSVFLNYLINNREPKYLCFYLVAKSYQNSFKYPDLKQRALAIQWTFCLPSSPLFVDLSEDIQHKISLALSTEEGEMRVRSIFVEARDVVANQIAEDLADFRHKRSLGLGSMFGEQKLSDNMTAAQEMEVAHTTLCADVKEILADRPSSVVDLNRNHALADSIYTFLLETSKGKLKSDSSLLDRLQSFTRTDLISKRKSNKSKKQNRCGHGFVLHTFAQLTFCDVCEGVIWGVNSQGFLCSGCESSVHRYGCLDVVSEPCTGKRKERRKPRKPSALSTISLLSAHSDRNAHIVQPSDGRDGDWYDDNRDPIAIHEEAYDNLGSKASDGRFRSSSDPKYNMVVHSPQGKDEEQLSKEQRKPKPQTATSCKIIRAQSLKEHRESQNHEMSAKFPSQDNSLNTTPSWNSVASSSGSMSDESLHTSSASSGQPGVSTATLVKGSMLDTVIEGTRVPPSLDDDTLQELKEVDVKDDPIPFRLFAKAEVVKRLTGYEIQKQELLRELVYTERTHLKKLMIMKHIYKTPLCRQGILTSQQTEQLFPSLEELVVMHSALCSDMRARQAQYPDGVIRNMADILLQRFDGAPGERLCHACSVFASNQGLAERLFKEWTTKNYKDKFRKFVQDVENNPYCNRLSLRELIPIVWMRLTKYRLLVENICNINKKHSKKLKDSDREESEKMDTVLTCIKNILHYVNKQVKQAENRQHLQDYQLKLDTTPLERTTHPIAEKYKDLILTSDNRVLLHEGTLQWKISHRRIVEVHALLLTDILVLLSRSEDGSDRFTLRRYHIESIGGAREEISPIIRLKEMLLRHFATDRGGRSFLVVNNSQLMRLAQMYEFTADSSKEKKRWEECIEKAMRGTAVDELSPEPMSPPGDESIHLDFAPLLSNLRDQLNKIDDEVQRHLDDKLAILRALQGSDRGDSLVLPPPLPVMTDKDGCTQAEAVDQVMELAEEMTAQVSKLMVPNPTRHIVADVQYHLNEAIILLHRNLSKLLVHVGEGDGSLSRVDGPPGMREGDSSSVNSGALFTSLSLPRPNSSTPQFDDNSDTTVSPTDDVTIRTDSTPLVTPLPDDSTAQFVVGEPSISAAGSVEAMSSTAVDGDSCDDAPPPLPQMPPPSSSGTPTPPDTLEHSGNALLGELELSAVAKGGGSRPLSFDTDDDEEFSSESLTRIIAPPDAFVGPGNNSPKLGPHYLTTNSVDSDHCRLHYGASSPQMQRSCNQPATSSEGFRRVRSNPSISSMRVLNIIPSSGDSMVMPMKRSVSQSVPQDPKETGTRMVSLQISPRNSLT